MKPNSTVDSDTGTTEPNFFTFLSSPAKLQEITLVRMASLLWHRAIENDRPWRHNTNELEAYLSMYKDYRTVPLSVNNWNADADIAVLATWSKSPPIHCLMRRIDDYAFESDNLNVVDLLNTRIPVELRKKLRRIASQMGILISNWIKQHFHLFADRTVFEVILADHFDLLVWHYDGQPGLCCEKTAANLVTRARLSELEKFCLACEYCMVDEIKTRWAAVSQHPFVENVCFQGHEILFYWVHLMKGELHKAPSTRSRSVEEYALLSALFHNGNSVEYFYSFIPAEKRVRKLIRLLKNSADRSLKSVLPKLSETQWKGLMASAAVKVIIYLMDWQRKSDYVLQVWRRFKDTISMDQFIKILFWMLEHEFQLESPYFTDDLRHAYTRIWLEAPEWLKNQMLEKLENDRKFVEEVISRRGDLSRPSELLILILSDASFEQRNKIWRENWTDLVYGTRPRYLKELMELCLPRDQINEFKANEMSKFENIREYCVDLMGRARYKELSMFLNFVCSSDKQKISKLEENISRMWRDYIYQENYSKDLDRLD